MHTDLPHVQDSYPAMIVQTTNFEIAIVRDDERWLSTDDQDRTRVIICGSIFDEELLSTSANSAS
jgi:hypothetical protein